MRRKTLRGRGLLSSVKPADKAETFTASNGIQVSTSKDGWVIYSKNDGKSWSYLKYYKGDDNRANSEAAQIAYDEAVRHYRGDVPPQEDESTTTTEPSSPPDEENNTSNAPSEEAENPGAVAGKRKRTRRHKRR